MYPSYAWLALHCRLGLCVVVMTVPLLSCLWRRDWSAIFLATMGLSRWHDNKNVCLGRLFDKIVELLLCTHLIQLFLQLTYTHSHTHSSLLSLLIAYLPPPLHPSLPLPSFLAFPTTPSTPRSCSDRRVGRESCLPHPTSPDFLLVWSPLYVWL